METARSSSSSHSFTPSSPSTAVIYRGLINAGTEICPERLVHGSTKNTLHIIYSLCSLTCCALVETNAATSKITHRVNPLLRLAGPCGLTQASKDLSDSGEGEHRPEAAGAGVCRLPRPSSVPRCRHHGLLCCQSPGERGEREERGDRQPGSRRHTHLPLLEMYADEVTNRNN